MGVQIPPILVVIACKTMLAGPLDENAKFTGYENLEWATEHSMMVCRRHEIQLYEPGRTAGAPSERLATATVILGP